MKRDQLQALVREEALANNGRLALCRLLEWLVPVAALRALAREHGLSPKGGFRLEKASPALLAPLLADPSLPDVHGAACALLAQTLVADAGAASEVPAETVAESRDLQPILKLKEQELARARSELERAREAVQGLRDRVAALTRAADADREQLTLQAKEVVGLRASLAEQPAATPMVPRDVASRIQTLEKELEEASQIEHQQRMRLAEQATLLRERDERIVELEALVPAGKRRRRKPPPPPPPERFTVPHFTPGFLKSLDGKDRRSIEQAYRAVFLFCTAGSRYPGLQVKSLEATTVWSMRASLHLRVYFRRRDDGDVDIVELVDREDQETALRRYREHQG